MTASRRPWFVAVCNVEPWLSVKPVNALITAEKLGGAAQGVPVYLDWYRNVGTQGTKRRTPAPTAIRAAHGASSGWSRWRVRQMDAPSQMTTIATRYTDQYCV